MFFNQEIRKRGGSYKILYYKPLFHHISITSPVESREPCEHKAYTRCFRLCSFAWRQDIDGGSWGKLRCDCQWNYPATKVLWFGWWLVVFGFPEFILKFLRFLSPPTSRIQDPGRNPGLDSDVQFLPPAWRYYRLAEKMWFVSRILLQEG